MYDTVASTVRPVSQLGSAKNVGRTGRRFRENANHKQCRAAPLYATNVPFIFPCFGSLNPKPSSLLGSNGLEPPSRQECSPRSSLQPHSGRQGDLVVKSTMGITLVSIYCDLSALYVYLLGPPTPLGGRGSLPLADRRIAAEIPTCSIPCSENKGLDLQPLSWDIPGNSSKSLNPKP